MLHFNNLYITEDGKNLVIDVAIDDMSYFKDVYLNSIAIDTQDSYVEGGPSKKAVIFQFLKDNKIKEKQLIVDATALGGDLNKKMFFVYATTIGTPTSDTPCGYDENIILGVVYNTYPIYNSIISIVKNLEEDCSEPIPLINRVLQVKVIEYAIKTYRYSIAIKYWKKFFMDDSTLSINKCKCNG